jgi:hypothetical protein
MNWANKKTFLCGDLSRWVDVIVLPHGVGCGANRVLFIFIGWDGIRMRSFTVLRRLIVLVRATQETWNNGIME